MIETKQKVSRIRITSADDVLIDTMPAVFVEVLRAYGSPSEIAAALKIPLGTAKSRGYRARKLLLKLRAAVKP